MPDHDDLEAKVVFLRKTKRYRSAIWGIRLWVVCLLLAFWQEEWAIRLFCPVGMLLLALTTPMLVLAYMKLELPHSSINSDVICDVVSPRFY